MGAVYTVEATFNIIPDNTNKIVEIMKTVLDDYDVSYESNATLLDMLHLIYVIPEQSKYNNCEVKPKDEYTEFYITSDFDASYSWENIMMKCFSSCAEYLENDSKLIIYPDSDYDELLIRNKKCIYVH